MKETERAPSKQAELIQSVLILGGGTAGWMTASYLKKAFPDLTITLVEAPNIPKIGVGEATVPNLQKVFFDFLGLPEDEWMRRCNASFKVAVKFCNWRTPRAPGQTDEFYHLFGLIPTCGNLSLSQHWAYRNMNGDREPLDYACYKEPPLLDAKLAPRYRDGQRAMYYAWHFDAHLVADYLRDVAVGWGVQHVTDQLENVELAEDGSIGALHTRSGRKMCADLFIDCSGFKGLLINKALREPFIDMSDHLFCDSAVATAIAHDDATHGVEPYTSAIAMNAGWTWKIPMLGRFGTGYVYSSRFVTDDQATRDFCALWSLNPDQTHLNKIRFRVGRNRRAWVKNCVSIGLSSCFVEPLESSGIYFIYAAIYQLAKHFPDKAFNPALAQHFNDEIAAMFDDTRDFIQLHYLTTPREDSQFWRANKYDLRLSDDVQRKVRTYKSGLPVNVSLSGADAYYDNFDWEFRNFWTNSSYYCILAGMGSYPDHAAPGIRHQTPLSLERAAEAFRSLKRQSAELAATLPTNYEFLRQLHGR
jgi:tryptophan halogenase